MSDKNIKKALGVLSPEATQHYTEAEKKELLELYSTFTSALMQPRKVVEAHITGIGKKYVTLDFGEKSDGFLPKTDFKDVENLKVGDKTEVYVEHLENLQGELVISRRKALHLKAWETLEEAQKNDTVLEGTVKRKIRGGLVLDILGIEVFLPGGQVDVVRTSSEELENYVGRVVEVLVIKISHKKQNVVVSHRKFLEREAEKHNEALITGLQPGQIVPAAITSIAPFGLFLRIDGKMVGLLHKSDMALNRRLPSIAEAVDSEGKTLFKVGQPMEVAIKDIDLEKKHVHLSTKLIAWSKLPEDVTEGSHVQGVVEEIADSFVLLRVLDGVIALLHVSEMSFGDHKKNPHDFVELGETLDVVVSLIDRERHELQVTWKPWIDEGFEKFAAKTSVGETHPAVVFKVHKNGAILKIQDGEHAVTGWLDRSNLHWLKKFPDPAAFLKQGDTVNVSLLAIDKNDRALRLGLRETTENPWPALAQTFSPGSVHECTILKMVNGGAIVQFAEEVESFLPSKELEGHKEMDKLKPGDKFPVKVIRFIQEDQKIMLSLDLNKDILSDADVGDAVKQRYAHQENQTHLGDLEVLKQLREELSETIKEKKPAKNISRKKKIPRSD